jgi:hypothetical protein
MDQPRENHVDPSPYSVALRDLVSSQAGRELVEAIATHLGAEVARDLLIYNSRHAFLEDAAGAGISIDDAAVDELLDALADRTGLRVE